MGIDDWKRAAIVGGVVLSALLAARLADRALARRLARSPEMLTRYRVLRRMLFVTIGVLGALSALLVVPGVRAVAGSILASSAIAGLVIGFAARSTLANFVAGLLIAFTQPLRIGDRVQAAGFEGAVEEVGLTYTVLRAPDGSRIFVPNELLASGVVKNATLATPRQLACARIGVPLGADLERALAALTDESRPLLASAAGLLARVEAVDATGVTLAVEVWTDSAEGVAELEPQLRRAAYRRLRDEGVYSR